MEHVDKGSAMRATVGGSERHLAELRLFLEELCCNICRFLHAERDGVAPEAVRIDQEAPLDTDIYADISVQVPGQPRYFVEVKYGYTRERLVDHLLRKYRPGASGLGDASRLVLVIDGSCDSGFDATRQAIAAGLAPGLRLEVWDEPGLRALIRERFDVNVDRFDVEGILDLRQGIDRAKGRYAFGDQWEHSHLQVALLWHFGFWRLKQLREHAGLSAREILPPGTYHHVVAVIADLCSFSSYVRDTRDDEVVRYCLTAFYSKARYHVLNNGGMMYQFAGDQLIALFGLPDHPPDYLDAALSCALGLLAIGRSIENEWQRRIDRVQGEQGVHIGIAVGDTQIVSLQPFGRARVGAVSDAINMAARLLPHAGPDEIAISNSYYQDLDPRWHSRFTAIAPIEARNVGRIRALKMHVGR